MKPYLQLLWLVTSITVAGCSSQGPEINVLTEKEEKKGWSLLLDGKTLDNWKTFNGGDVIGWRIEDGILYNSGAGSEHGGDIITRAEYGNFELYLEWRISAGSSSGIFFHVKEGIANTIEETGPEYQLIDDEGFSGTLAGNQLTGASCEVLAPRNARPLPVGQWNKTRIKVQDSHVEHWLNDDKVLEYKLWTNEWNELKNKGKFSGSPHYGSAREGHIGLQDHGGLVMFRNIKIRELPAPKKDK